jgi:hypothetical protein
LWVKRRKSLFSKDSSVLREVKIFGGVGSQTLCYYTAWLEIDKEVGGELEEVDSHAIGETSMSGAIQIVHFDGKC